MRPAPSTIAVATLGLGLVVLGLWVASQRGVSENAPVGFPADAVGIVDELPSSPRSAASAGPTTLTVDVVPRAQLLAPAAAPCRLVADGVELAQGLRLLAGARAAAPEAEVGGRHLVAFRLADGRELCRVVYLRDDAPVDVEWRGTVAFEGRVQDDEGAPVAGATVWSGELAPDGSLLVTTTDADGAFRFESLADAASVPLTTWAGGRAARLDVIDAKGHGSDPFVVWLEPAAALDVVFTPAVAHPELGRVVLAPAERGAALAHYPFFLAGLRGTDRLSPDGTASVDDLPPTARLAVRVDHPFASSAFESVRPRRGRARAVVRGDVLPTIAGTVSTPEGIALAGVTVSASAEAAAMPEQVGLLLDPAAHRTALRTAVTDAAGHYAIGRPGGGGSARLAFRRVDRLGLRVEVGRAHGDLRHDVVLPERAPLHAPFVLRVHLQPLGRTIRARRGSAAAVTWTDLEPFELRLGGASVVDVLVRLERPDAAPIELRREALAVHGPTDLRLDG